MTEYNGMKVGDVISTYHAGYHRLESIEVRPPQKSLFDKSVTFKPEPLFYYRKVVDSNGKQASGKTLLCCDAAYCRPAKETLSIVIKNIEDNLQTLKEFYAKVQSV